MEGRQMNEIPKKYIAYAGCIVLAVIAVCALWLLFRDVRTDTDPDQRAGQHIEQTGEQQRNAAAEIAAVRAGTDAAKQSAADIADSNGGGTAVADRIADSQQSAQTGITDAEESVERIADQSDRIAKASRRAKNNIESAEAANQSAAGALDRALQLCRECRELNTSSQSIITTGQGRDAGSAEGARKD